MKKRVTSPESISTHLNTHMHDNNKYHLSSVIRRFFFPQRQLKNLDLDFLCLFQNLYPFYKKDLDSFFSRKKTISMIAEFHKTDYND